MLRKTQEGVSVLTVMLLAPLVGLFILMVLKLIPIYLEYESVKSVLNGMISDRAAAYSSPAEVRGTILKRWNINGVTNATNDNILVEREGGVYTINVDYEVVVPLFFNLSLLVTFSDKGEVSAS